MPASPRLQFDYVVIGGGSAGAVVASRLSENPHVRVALIEAGPSDVGDEKILQVDRWMGLLESGYDWDYPIEPQQYGNSFLRHARARVLGGCSSHNSCIAFWPPREDLDDWAAVHGATGWDADTLWPVLQRLESNDEPGEHHGHAGPVRLRTVPPRDPCGTAVLEACAQAGIPTVRFNDGSTVVTGAGWFQINVREDGVRSSSSVSYLHPHLDRPNLTLLTEHRAQRLLVDERRRCTGVQVQTPDLLHSAEIAAEREVIVSVGAIDSPKLLLLSGIGPAEHLRDLGLEVLVDAPGVGSHLQDHPEGVIQWQARRPMPIESTQWWEIGIFASTGPDPQHPGRPDLMFHYGSVPFDMHTVRQGYPTTENGFCLTPNVTHARSRGTVRLRSRDFRDKPRVDPRYFTDPHDITVMTAGIRLARDIAARPALADWTGPELFPGPDVRSDDEITDYLRRTHNTVYHPAGTVRMGSAADRDAPLDPQLRLKGVTGLRVADASVMPELVTVNPNITTMMIGERCAELVAADVPAAG